MRNIVLDNITFCDYEVAAIALNGSSNTIINDIDIKNASQDIKVLSSYSQSLFILDFLRKLYKSNPTAFLMVKGREKKIYTIINELNKEIKDTYDRVVNKNQMPNNLYLNKS